MFFFVLFFCAFFSWPPDSLTFWLSPWYLNVQIKCALLAYWWKSVLFSAIYIMPFPFLSAYTARVFFCFQDITMTPLLQLSPANNQGCFSYPFPFYYYVLTYMHMLTFLSLYITCTLRTMHSLSVGEGFTKFFNVLVYTYTGNGSTRLKQKYDISGLLILTSETAHLDLTFQKIAVAT